MMKNNDKTKEQLLKEIALLKAKIAKLEKNKELFQIITEKTIENIAITTFDQKAKYLYVSPSIKHVLGYDPEDLLGKSFFDFIHPDDKRVLLPLVKKYISSVIGKVLRIDDQKITETIEFRFKDKAGNWRYMQSTVNFVEKNLLAFTRDITERKQAEEKEKEHQKYIELLSETAMRFVELPQDKDIYTFIGEQLGELIGKDSYFVINTIDEKCILTTRAVLGIGKFTDKIVKLMGRHPVGTTLDAKDKNLSKLSDGKLHLNKEGLSGIFLKTVPKTVCNSLEKLLNIKKTYGIGFIKDGELFGTIVIILKEDAGELKNKKTIETFIKQASIAIQKRQVEEALKESNENFQQVVSNITTVVWKADIGENGTFENTYSSPVVDELLDLSAGTLKNDWDKYFGYIKPEYLEQVNNAFREAIISPGKKIDCQYEVLKDNGQTAWFQSIGRCFEKNGKSHVFGSTIDITDRKKAEEEVRKLSKVVETTPDAVMITDMQGTIEYVNQGLLTLGSYEDDSLTIGKSVFMFSTAEGENQLKEKIIPTILAKGEWRGEVPVKRKDGSIFPTDMVCSLILDEEGKPKYLLSQFHDITKRKKAEEGLMKKTEQLISGEKELKRLYGESEQVRKSLLSILEDVAQKEEALQESEKKYRDLFEKSEDASLVIHNGKFTDCNQAAINMLRYNNKNELLMRHPSELSPEKQPDGKLSFTKANEMMKKAIKNGSHRFEWIHKRSNGEVFPVEVLLTSISTDEKNEIIHTVWRDVTIRNQTEELLQKSEEKYRLLADNSMDAIWQMDKKLVFTYISPAVKNIMGYTVDEWVGTSLSQHASKKDFFNMSKKALYTIKNYKKLKHLTFEAVMLKKDGNEVPIEITGRLLLNKRGLPIGFQGTTRDITERRKTEKELIKYHEHLEETVKQRTGEIEYKSKKLQESQNALTFLLEDVNDARYELEKTNLQLKTANKEMESFTYSVSHDLRAPLRAILGFSNKFAEIYGGKVDEEGTRLLNVINTNTRKMGTLIDDLLAFSKMGRSDMRKERIDIKGLAHETWNEQKDQYADRKIKLTITNMPVAKGDRNMLRQVLFNLLSNAAKFSKNKEVSRIEVGAKAGDSETIYYVKDNGVGFDMKYKDKLFEVFQRLHSEREFEGTGVGLAIVKKVVDVHGGKVWAKSTLNKGATIYFSLPK